MTTGRINQVAIPLQSLPVSGDFPPVWDTDFHFLLLGRGKLHNRASADAATRESPPATNNNMGFSPFLPPAQPVGASNPPKSKNPIIASSGLNHPERVLGSASIRLLPWSPYCHTCQLLRPVRPPLGVEPDPRRPTQSISSSRIIHGVLLM